MLDDPARCVGACLPDMLSAIDRRCRLRERNVRPLLIDPDPFTRDVMTGVLMHLDDDAWFHAGEPFLTTSARLTRAIRRELPTDDSHRVGFLGHILVEIFLDRWLIERDATLLPRLHRSLDSIDPNKLETLVNRAATKPTERLAPMYRRMVSERFLDDYPHDEPLLRRINGVLKRVTLPQLEPRFALLLGQWHREFVVPVATTLLPPDVANGVTSGSSDVSQEPPREIGA